MSFVYLTVPIPTMKRLVLILFFALAYTVSHAQQYNTIIINGPTNNHTPKQEWYTIETNNSEKYPIWKTFFTNGTIIVGRGEYLNEHLVNIETNNSDKYPIWKVYNMSGAFVSMGRGYVAANGLVVIETNNSEEYPIWVTYTSDGRFISRGRP